MRVVLVLAMLLIATPAYAVEVVGAGDIATSGGGDTKTSNLVLAIAPDVVLTFGDNAYPDGSPSQFNSYYHPTWGRFRNITKPSPGNHDWKTSGAGGYTGYFGFPVNGVVAYEELVPGWDIYQVDTQKWGAAQQAALVGYLADNPDSCEIVYGHHPRWSSGEHGDDASKQSLWSTLTSNRVDLLLSGHDHDYERFAKMNASGVRDPLGTRQLIVGTGGVATRAFASPSHGVSVKKLTGSANWGVIDLELIPGSYTAAFTRATGGLGTIADTFGSTCTV